MARQIPGLQAVNPRLKLILALGWLTGLALTPEGLWPLFAAHAGLVLLTLTLSGLPWRAWLQRSLWVSPFLLIVLPLPFTTPGSPLCTLIVGPYRLTATQPGLIRLVSLILRIGLSWQVALLLLSSTRHQDLLLALRAFHLPRLLVSSTALMLRYLDLLSDTAQMLMRARAARSPQPSSSSFSPSRLAWQARVTGSMAGNLLLRALERSERLHAAMLARGFDGEIRDVPPAPSPPAESS